MTLYALRLLCLLLLGVAGATAQTGKPVANSGEPGPGQTDQGSNAGNATKQPQAKPPVPPSIQQAVERLQNFWNTQFDNAPKTSEKLTGSSQGTLTFNISKTLKNFQVSY